jgi:transketolase
MRTAFVNTLAELMKQHDEIVVLTADMGYSVFESLFKEFPNRTFNTGVTEQSSIGLAAGLAMSGYKVFLYAQAVFMTMRCYEQFRLDIAYQNLNVKIIGTAAGFSLNQLGVSHYALEDIGLVRLMPNVNIFTPGDAFESKWSTLKAYETKGPAYIRLTKDNLRVHKTDINIKISDSIKINDGKDASLFVSGSVLPLAYEISNDLKKMGIKISLVSCPSIRPLNFEQIINEINKTRNVFTMEEHFVNGGFGTMIAEIIADNNINSNFHRLGIFNDYPKVTGSAEFLKNKYGLSKNEIINTIKASVLKKSKICYER